MRGATQGEAFCFRKRRYRVAVSQKLIFLAALSLPLLAQPSPIVTLLASQNNRALAASHVRTGGQEPVTTIRTRVDEVYVIFTVTDKQADL